MAAPLFPFFSFVWHYSWPVPVVEGMSHAGVVGEGGGGRVSLSPNLPVGWVVSLGPLVWVQLVQGVVLYAHPVLGRVAILPALERDGYVTVVLCGSFCLVVRLWHPAWLGPRRVFFRVWFPVFHGHVVHSSGTRWFVVLLEVGGIVGPPHCEVYFWACVWCSGYIVSTSSVRQRLCSVSVGVSVVRLCNILGVLYVGGPSRL